MDELRMTPEEEEVHVLSIVDILEPFSDEELRETFVAKLGHLPPSRRDLL
jgi:hypothetical protein